MKSDLLTAKFPQITWEESSKSFVVPSSLLLEAVAYLKNHPDLAMDYASNLTGVDWLDRKEKVKGADGKETEVSKTGYLEVVYHFYSMAKKHGPIAIRCRTNGREKPELPSITPLFRGAEFQEREIFDLFGIRFTGHPDLRRILMWEEFKDFPMRKDYQQPDDYEWEPTPHDDIVEKARSHYSQPT